MGSLHYIDLGVFWASWGGSGKEPGSRNRFWVTGLAVPGNQFQEPDLGFDGFRQVLRFQETGFPTPRFWGQKVACPRVRRFWCSMGSDGLGSVPEVWTELALGARFRKPEVLSKVLSSEDSVPEVPKVTLYFESFTFVLGKYTFVL